MRPGDAAAEDARRVGVALIVTGLVAGLLEDRVAPVAAAGAAVLGIALLIGGYWMHRIERRRERRRAEDAT